MENREIGNGALPAITKAILGMLAFWLVVVLIILAVP